MVSAVDPSTDSAHLVYVSEGLAAAVGRPVLGLLGRAARCVVRRRHSTGPVGRGGRDGGQWQAGRAAMALQRADGSSVPVHATFLAVPSLSDGWPVYIALFRLVRPADAERSESGD